jgi:hypothetical protein
MPVIDVAYVEGRDRITTLFRIILAIPHLVVSGAWQYVVNIVSFVQWVIILLTGKRNDSIWRFQNQYLAYATRVSCYAGLMYDEPYPAFVSDPGTSPVRYEFMQPIDVNRLTNALRIIWVIPAYIIAIVVGFAAGVLTLVSWFVIVITGKHPRGMFDFMLRVHRFSAKVQAYALLMTDTYPKFGG